MRAFRAGIRQLTLSIIVVAALSVASVSAVAAPAFNPDPGTGGGGGGNLCWSQSCAFCGRDCNESGTSCWAKCFYEEWRGACACWFQNGACSGNGSCTYVP